MSGVVNGARVLKIESDIKEDIVPINPCEFIIKLDERSCEASQGLCDLFRYICTETSVMMLIGIIRLFGVEDEFWDLIYCLRDCGEDSFCEQGCLTGFNKVWLEKTFRDPDELKKCLDLEDKNEVIACLLPQDMRDIIEIPCDELNEGDICEIQNIGQYDCDELLLGEKTGRCMKYYAKYKTCREIGEKSGEKILSCQDLSWYTPEYVCKLGECCISEYWAYPREEDYPGIDKKIECCREGEENQCEVKDCMMGEDCGKTKIIECYTGQYCRNDINGCQQCRLLLYVKSCFETWRTPDDAPDDADCCDPFFYCTTQGEYWDPEAKECKKCININDYNTCIKKWKPPESAPDDANCCGTMSNSCPLGKYWQPGYSGKPSNGDLVRSSGQYESTDCGRSDHLICDGTKNEICARGNEDPCQCCCGDICTDGSAENPHISAGYECICEGRTNPQCVPCECVPDCSQAHTKCPSEEWDDGCGGKCKGTSTAEECTKKEEDKPSGTICTPSVIASGPFDGGFLGFVFILFLSLLVRKIWIPVYRRRKSIY